SEITTTPQARSLPTARMPEDRRDWLTVAGTRLSGVWKINAAPSTLGRNRGGFGYTPRLHSVDAAQGDGRRARQKSDPESGRETRLLNRALFSRMEPSSAIVQADSVRDESFRLQPLKTYEPGSLRGSCSLDLCDDECGPAEFGLVQNLHAVRQEPEEGIGPQESSLSATLCGLTFEPSSERRKPCPVDRGGEVGLTPCGAAPCPEQLDPLPR